MIVQVVWRTYEQFEAYYKYLQRRGARFVGFPPKSLAKFGMGKNAVSTTSRCIAFNNFLAYLLTSQIITPSELITDNVSTEFFGFKADFDLKDLEEGLNSSSSSSSSSLSDSLDEGSDDSIDDSRRLLNLNIINIEYHQPVVRWSIKQPDGKLKGFFSFPLLDEPIPARLQSLPKKSELEQSTYTPKLDRRLDRRLRSRVYVTEYGKGISFLRLLREVLGDDVRQTLSAYTLDFLSWEFMSATRQWGVGIPLRCSACLSAVRFINSFPSESALRKVAREMHEEESMGAAAITPRKGHDFPDSDKGGKASDLEAEDHDTTAATSTKLHSRADATTTTKVRFQERSSSNNTNRNSNNNDNNRDPQSDDVSIPNNTPNSHSPYKADSFAPPFLSAATARPHSLPPSVHFASVDIVEHYKRMNPLDDPRRCSAASALRSSAKRCLQHILKLSRRERSCGELFKASAHLSLSGLPSPNPHPTSSAGRRYSPPRCGPSSARAVLSARGVPGEVEAAQAKVIAFGSTGRVAAPSLASDVEQLRAYLGRVLSAAVVDAPLLGPPTLLPPPLPPIQHYSQRLDSANSLPGAGNLSGSTLPPFSGFDSARNFNLKLAQMPLSGNSPPFFAQPNQIFREDIFTFPATKSDTREKPKVNKPHSQSRRSAGYEKTKRVRLFSHTVG